MGTGNLTDRSIGQTILDTFFNDIHAALDGDFVGRNSSGTPTSLQNLGTVAIPWGTVRASSIVLGGASIDTSQLVSMVNRVTSGKVRSTSNQPAFITPNGAAASFVLAGASTNLVVDVNGSAVTVNTDITKSSLTLAPSSNNTCTVNDATATSQADTRNWGEDGSNSNITVQSMGSNITALVGTFAAFKLGGGSTEYFWAYVSSTTKLTKCLRGAFYDSSLNPINRTTFANTNTITLMKAGFVFIQNDGTTIDVTYNVPKYQVTTPSGPATGDYWYDLANSQWKRYDGASFQIINRTYIGMVIMDSTNCVAARCAPFYKNYRNDNTIDLEFTSVTNVQSTNPYSYVNVAGNIFKFGETLPQWNITTMLASSVDMYNATEQASTLYYCYIKDTGDTVISDIPPYHPDSGRLGSYHPHNPWRCVGSFYNDGSSNIVSAGKMFTGQIFPKMPTVQRLTSGSGTYQTPAGVKFLRVRGIAGGGGGGGGGTAGGSASGAGGQTTFGTSLLTGNGGSAGGWNTTGAPGGSASVSSPALQLCAYSGGAGTGSFASGSGQNGAGGPGATSPFGGNGAGGYATSAGTAAIANTGSGGGGGGSPAGGLSGCAGGAGGYFDAIIPNPNPTYAYTVGALGSAGAAGTGGGAGGAGGSGVIIVEEYYFE